MVRQARTYLVGALSGVTLIGAAIVVFVVLVSAQVFHDWPIAELAGHDQKAAVAPGKALPASAGTGGVTASTARPNAGKARAGAGAGDAANSQPAAHRKGAAEAGALAQVPTTVSSNEGSTSTGGNDSSSGNSGSRSSSPGSTSSPTGSNSGSSGGSSGSSGSGSGGPATASSGSSGSGGGSGGSSTATTPPPTTKKPPTVAEAVNGTVAGVDETVTGGALEKAGVTEVTEGVVNGVVGPESVVGKTVEGVGEVVGGLLGGSGH